MGAVSGVDVTTERLDPSWVTAVQFIQASTGYVRADVDAFQREMGNEVLRRWRTGRGRFEPDEVRTVRFGLEAGGYSINQVEAFVYRVATELERFVAHPSEPIVTPADIAARRLRKSAGGFAMAEVDLYLDRVADELRAMQRGRPSSLTAARLRSVRFPTAIRGYAPAAVDELLAEIGREVARIQARYFGR